MVRGASVGSRSGKNFYPMATTPPNRRPTLDARKTQLYVSRPDVVLNVRSRQSPLKTGDACPTLLNKSRLDDLMLLCCRSARMAITADHANKRIFLMLLLQCSRVNQHHAPLM